MYGKCDLVGSTRYKDEVVSLLFVLKMNAKCLFFLRLVVFFLSDT